MTPMIDIIFQLVIFFMISSVFNTAPGIDIELPDSQAVESLEVTQLTITINSEENVYLNKNLVPITSLKKALGEYRVNDDKTQTVVLKGDKSASYGTFVEVMGIIRDSGFDQINMITTTQPRDK